MCFYIKLINNLKITNLKVLILYNISIYTGLNLTLSKCTHILADPYLTLNNYRKITIKIIEKIYVKNMFECFFIEQT